MKYIITGLHSSGKGEVAELLEGMGVRVGKKFTNANLISPDYDYFSDDDVREIFENKAYVFIKDVRGSQQYFEGLSLHSLDNNDVFILTPDEFVSCAPTAFNDEEICFVWMDNTMSNRLNRYENEKRQYNFKEIDKLEKEFMSDFIKNVYSFPKSHILYFMNEEPMRVSAIIYALVKYPDLFNEFEIKFS